MRGVVVVVDGKDRDRRAHVCILVVVTEILQKRVQPLLLGIANGGVSRAKGVRVREHEGVILHLVACLVVVVSIYMLYISSVCLRRGRFDRGRAEEGVFEEDPAVETARVL